MKKVILSLGTGTLIKGCESVMGEVLGEFQLEGNVLAERSSRAAYPIRFTGQLPPAPQLAATQQQWQRLYAARNQDHSLRIHLLQTEGLRYSERDFSRCCSLLCEQLNAWLRTAEFLKIDQTLRTELKRTDDIQIILETVDVQIRKLPWHLWQLLSDYPSAELTFSAPDWRPLLAVSPLPSPSSGSNGAVSQSRILATFGNHEGLDLAADLAALNSLSNTHLSLLESPSLSHLHEMLWQPQGWDIFFFAGHSQTQGETGIVNLNSHERLTIEQIKHALGKAIANGLKIAIFNSCDGLGLAQQLSELGIPYIVVMREPVPDAVAQQFLRYLLIAFAEGRPFHLAMREARQRLSGIENNIPCASWLPIIWQNPTAPAIYWQNSSQPHGLATQQFHEPSAVNLPSPIPGQIPGQLSDQNPELSLARKKRLTAGLKGIALKSLAISTLVLAARALGLLEPLGFAAYDQLMRQRPTEAVDSRIVVVELSEETTSHYGYPLPDEPLTALIDRLNQAQPLAIGLDLHRARPNPTRVDLSQAPLQAPSQAPKASSEPDSKTGYERLLQQVEETPSLFLVCFYSSDDENYRTPAQLSEELRLYQVGFSDIPIDQFKGLSGNPRGDLTLQGRSARMGEAVRRQWLSYDPDLSPVSENCETPYSLSLQLAFQYLEARGTTPLAVTDDENWQLGPVVFESLPARVGEYQQLGAHSGAILLNYRANQPGEKLTFEQIMSDSFDPQRLHNKIVLVGYTAPVSKDYFQTPYGPMAGLWVHAHMVSQITSAVIDKRPLIKGLPQWGQWQWADWLWVLTWGCAGGAAGWFIKAQPRWLLSLVLGGLALYGSCWLALTSGLWLPLVPSALAALGSTVWLKLSRYSAGDFAGDFASDFASDLVLEPQSSHRSRLAEATEAPALEAVIKKVAVKKVPSRGSPTKPPFSEKELEEPPSQ